MLDKVTRLSSGDLKEMERRTQPNELFAIRKIAIIEPHHRLGGRHFAARGYQVTAYCRSPASAQKFDSFIQIAWRKILKRGLSKDQRLAQGRRRRYDCRGRRVRRLRAGVVPGGDCSQAIDHPAD